MAAFMASAYAKFTGELGVCIGTSGPGASHLITGLYDARLDHMPVLAIAGQQIRTTRTAIITAADGARRSGPSRAVCANPTVAVHGIGTASKHSPRTERSVRVSLCVEP
jgi:glyoxylate carboligase